MGVYIVIDDDKESDSIPLKTDYYPSLLTRMMESVSTRETGWDMDENLFSFTERVDARPESHRRDRVFTVRSKHSHPNVYILFSQARQAGIINTVAKSESLYNNTIPRGEIYNKLSDKFDSLDSLYVDNEKANHWGPIYYQMC